MTVECELVFSDRLAQTLWTMSHLVGCWCYTLVTTKAVLNGGNAKVSHVGVRIPPMDTGNVCKIFYGNPYKRRLGNSVWTKVVDRLTDQHYHATIWLKIHPHISV